MAACARAVELSPGMCAGFPANGRAHHLENRTGRDVLVPEVGDRGAGDQVSYPNDDLARLGESDVPGVGYGDVLAKLPDAGHEGFEGNSSTCRARRSASASAVWLG